ncbi:MAG: acetyl-CoA acetyltransferase [Spirochaetia bacterium]|nr:acetyl-CoA acetyltransferase [Spirochaetia bacterium]
MKKRVYILGGFQTDFSRNWSKEGKSINALIKETVLETFEQTKINPEDIHSVHMANFAGELYNKQGHLGAFIQNAHSDLRGLPSMRHEAACASGSVAVLAARAEIEAGIYDTILVVGAELMKSVDSKTGGDYLGTAAWYEKEAEGIEYPFPKLFGKLGTVYQERYGLKYEHLAEISQKNYANAKRNENAQTREYFMSKDHACSLSKYNPEVGGIVRITDCSQVTDGAASVILASHEAASDWCKKNNIAFETLPFIEGWGHTTAPVLFDEKMEHSKDNEYVLPFTRKAVLDAYERAGIKGADDLDVIETHDCFTTSEYMAIEHIGITEPGKAWRAVEDKTIHFEGRLPVNPSGGLIGAGHPVGATGVRQILDAYKQVSGKAGGYQIKNAKRVLTLNMGGSATTNVVHIISREK